MSNIGRTVRASFQLKDQLEAIVTTRLDMIKRIDDRCPGNGKDESVAC